MKLLFATLGIPTWLVVSVAAAAFMGFVYWIYDEIGDARQEKVINQIEDQNNEVREKADLAELGFDDCIAAGGVYDFASSKCGRPQVSHR